MVPLIPCHSDLQVKTTEASLIQKWTPMLNFPFIIRLMPTKKVTSTKQFVHSLSTKFGVPGNRLFRKLRRRLFHTMRLHLYHRSLFQNDHQWHILFQLAENSYQSFQMVKSLRSAQYSTDQIFALCRLANNLEDPPRSKVRSLLKKAIQFKGAMLPCRAKALLIPVLARSSFSTQVRSWLKNIVIERKDFLTPFHLPVCSVIPGRFPTIENKLYSHFGWMKKFSWDHPPQCPCQQIRELHPDLTTTSIEGIDHIASEARLLTVSRRLQFWLSCSAQTQVYPDFEEYCRISWHAVDQWLQHYKIGGIQYLRWREFIAKQWTLHQKSAVVPVSMADIKYLRTLVDELVVQGRDHAATHIHVYCPFLYHHVLRSTFGDPKVYTKRNMTPTAARKYLSQVAAAGWLRKYRRGIKEHTEVPTSYILLKAKKKFLGARPIINYQSFPFGRLFRCTAFVLMAMMKDVFPHSFGNATLPQMFSFLHSFLSETPLEHHLLQSNQDLVGFFTSIPADRIHDAVHWMLQSTRSYIAMMTT